MQNHHRVMFCKMIWRQRNLRVAQHPPRRFLNYHQGLCWCQHILFLAWPFQRSISNSKTQTNRPSTNTTYSMPTTISNGNPRSQSANMFSSWLDLYILVHESIIISSKLWTYKFHLKLGMFCRNSGIRTDEKSSERARHFDDVDDPIFAKSNTGITLLTQARPARAKLVDWWRLHFFEPAERSWFLVNTELISFHGSVSQLTDAFSLWVTVKKGVATS